MVAAGLALTAAAPKAVAAGCVVLTQATRAQVRTVAPSLRMSGVGANGANVDVRFTVKGAAGLVQAVGPLHLLERDNRAHAIASRRAKTLRLPPVGPKGTGIRRAVKHPGTTGQHPFAKGVAKGLPATERAMAAVLVQATTKALR